MSTDRGKLGNFLKEVIDWRWDEFCRAEKELGKYTAYESAVFSLVRTCSQAKLGAIKLAIDRVDGKLETPIKIEYPKVWLVYPDAKSVAALPEGEAPPAELPSPETLPDIVPEEPAEEGKMESAITLSLREMVAKMADQPREVVPLILGAKEKVEAKVANGEEVVEGDTIGEKAPMVKSVIAANLLHLAIEQNKFEAITEVFDQIDGKLVETFKILAGDIFLTEYALEAPYGAVQNSEGVYMIEDKGIAEEWKQKFKKPL